MAEPFLVVLGVGHDARILADLGAAAKARGGWLAYLVPGLRRLRHTDQPVGVVIEDDRPAPGAGPDPAPAPDTDVGAGPRRRAGSEGSLGRRDLVWSVLVVNAATLPLGARVVPTARVDDGLLHVATVTPRSLLDWGRIARSGWGGAPAGPDVLDVRTGTVVRLHLPAPATVQVDGDVVRDIVEARIEIRRGAVQVAVGPRR